MITTEILLKVTVFIVFWHNKVSTIKWLALHKNNLRTFSKMQHCQRTKKNGFVKYHVSICKQNIDLMPTVKDASYLAVDSCQSEFANWRWNCSSVVLTPKLTQDLKLGTREQAFVYAVTSSALAHSVARACSLGVTRKCSCGSLPNSNTNGTFKWGGCGDDIRYGLLFSEYFTNATLLKKGRPKKSKMAAMNRHNHRVGRMVIKDSVTIACKCHGVSGSCSVKTCWRSLPPFKIISAFLKRQYANAVEVKYIRSKKVKQLIPVKRNILRLHENQLVYIRKSPDYCTKDKKTGSMGTHGRYCKQERKSAGNCNNMCCGRGYESVQILVKERCECKYHWCCYVKCRECTRTLNLHMCR